MSNWENDPRKWDVQDLTSGRNERYQDAGIPQPMVRKAEGGQRRMVVTETLWNMSGGWEHRATKLMARDRSGGIRNFALRHFEYFQDYRD